MLWPTHCSWTHRSHLYSLAAHCSVESGRNRLHWRTFSGCTVDSLQKTTVLSTFFVVDRAYVFASSYSIWCYCKDLFSFSGNVPFIRTVHLWNAQHIWEAGEVPRKCVLNLCYYWEAVYSSVCCFCRKPKRVVGVLPAQGRPKTVQKGSIAFLHDT